METIALCCGLFSLKVAGRVCGLRLSEPCVHVSRGTAGRTHAAAVAVRQ